jgi:hypothetical protein
MVVVTDHWQWMFTFPMRFAEVIAQMSVEGYGKQASAKGMYVGEFTHP